MNWRNVVVGLGYLFIYLYMDSFLKLATGTMLAYYHVMHSPVIKIIYVTVLTHH